MIEVSNLTKKYGDHIAVDHLSFRVEKGQIYGFLGPKTALYAPQPQTPRLFCTPTSIGALILSIA